MGARFHPPPKFSFIFVHVSFQLVPEVTRGPALGLGRALFIVNTYNFIHERKSFIWFHDSIPGVGRLKCRSWPWVTFCWLSNRIYYRLQAHWHSIRCGWCNNAQFNKSNWRNYTRASCRRFWCLEAHDCNGPR